MKRQVKNLALLCVCIVMLPACGLLYDATQPARKHECYQLPKSQQQECLDRTMTYEEYKKAREKDAAQDQ